MTLTEREIEFLQLASYGYRYKDIAETLHLGHWYVRRRFSELQQKMGTDTLSHAVAVALRQGLIQ